MIWKRCSRSPIASPSSSMAASSPRAIRRRSGLMRRYAKPILASRTHAPMPEHNTKENLLELSGIETSYGLSRVLFGISLSIAPGEMVSLMGRNGMGKTTTVRSIMGLTRAGAGSIRFAGQEIRDLPAYRVAKLGIGLVPEGRQVFANLTARENLVATAANRGGANDPWTLDKVLALFPAFRALGQHGQSALRRRATDARDRPR